MTVTSSYYTDNMHVYFYIFKEANLVNFNIWTYVCNINFYDIFFCFNFKRTPRLFLQLLTSIVEKLPTILQSAHTYFAHFCTQ